MKLMYMILAAASMYLAFLCLSVLPAGFRELLVVCWVAVAVLCLYLFAKPEGSGTITSYDSQRDYQRQLDDIGRGRRDRDRFGPP